MKEPRQDEIDGSAATAGKAEWARPEVDRLCAGGAEGADGADVDGADLQS